jgi:hypothetical protein
VFGPGGLLLGHFSSHAVHRGSMDLLDFRPLVDHWDIEFDPRWTEKMGLYTIQEIKLPFAVSRACSISIIAKK